MIRCRRLVPGILVSLSLAACGGSSGGEGGSGQTTGSGGATSSSSSSGASSSSSTSSTSSGASSSSSTSSTSSSGASSSSSSSSTSSSGGSAGVGIHVTANGTPVDIPYTSHSAAGLKGLVITTSAGSFPAMTIVIEDGKALGTYSCAPGKQVTQMGYTTYAGGAFTLYTSQNAGTSCTIQITQVAPQPGDHLLGTFSAVLTTAAGDATMTLTNGSFDVIY